MIFLVSDGRFIMFDTKSEALKGVKQLKKDLFDELQNLQDSHAAIVHHIEMLPGEAAMTFHAFCDNENAPFKQVYTLSTYVISFVTKKLN